MCVEVSFALGRGVRCGARACAAAAPPWLRPSARSTWTSPRVLVAVRPHIARTLRLYVELLPCYTHMMLDRAHADARVVFASFHDHPRANAKARKPHVCRHLSCRVASAPMATRRLSSWWTSCCFTLQMHFGGIVCGARSYRDLPS